MHRHEPPDHVSLSRREALGRLGAAAVAVAGGGLPGCGAAPLARGAPGTEAGALGPLGVQLYTLRSEMERSVEGTLARVAAIGYREVEFAGYFDRTPARLREALATAGLAAPSAHVPVEALASDWTRTLDQAAGIGHRWLVVPSLPESMRDSLDAWRRTAEVFERAAEEAKRHGIGFAFHNHAVDVQPLEGRVPLDVLCEETDPSLVAIELDLFWITHGGGDAVAFLERWPGRVPMVHVKDRTDDGRMVDVGAGAIDWRRIFARRAEAGIVHTFVEHDRPEDPFASVEASFAYLNALEV